MTTKLRSPVIEADLTRCITARILITIGANINGGNVRKCTSRLKLGMQNRNMQSKHVTKYRRLLTKYSSLDSIDLFARW